MPKVTMSDDLYYFLDIEVEELFCLVESLAHLPGSIFLYSGSDFDSSERSYFWAFPYDTIHIRNGIIRHGAIEIVGRDVWQALKAEVQNGTWAGFIGYEMGFYAESTLKPLLKQMPASPIDTHDLYLQRSCFEVIYDHKAKTLQIAIDRLNEKKLPATEKLLCENITEEVLQKLLLEERSPIGTVGPFQVMKAFEPFEHFASNFEAIQEAIRSGDVYQLNLSHEIIFSGKCKPFDLFSELVQRNQVSFFAYLYLQDYAIVSASPERFLRRKGDMLETRPIKGTRPRGESDEEDKRLLDELLTSEKEASELTMIIDLMRNDLAKVSVPGTVKVDEQFRIEAYRHIYHRLGVIQAKSKQLHPIDILQQTFPGGSVTGCPKISSMQQIFELEQRRRGVYTGSIGYMRDNGDFDFSIAIRTAVMNKSRLSFAVGGGIVIDSDVESEYLETKYKAQSLLEVLNVSEKLL